MTSPQVCGELVLASASPRRAALLAHLGLRLHVRPANIDESTREGENAYTYVARMALEKAEVAVREGETALGADTAVEIDGRILGKPTDDDHARRTLRHLSGRIHLVHTGVAVVRSSTAGRVHYTEVTTTAVRFVEPSDDEIEWYIKTREPFDKAGGYALQGAGAAFVEGILGSASNVVGLPVESVRRLLARVGLICRISESAADAW